MNNMNELMTHTEECSSRYMEAEKKLLEIMELPWYHKIYSRKTIQNFLTTQLKKYKF